MSRELIKTINNKISGKPYDEEKYTTGIAKIIESVYKHRYPYIRIPKLNDYKWLTPHSRKIAELTTVRTYIDGTLLANFDTFFNLCLDELYDNNLLYKIYDRTFYDDRKLKRFIYIAFECLLQKMIDDFTPGLETRKKQVHKILNKCCFDISFEGSRCWKLKEFTNKNIKPANLEQLLDIAQSLKLPELRFPKKKNARRGPSISKVDMENYLLTLLKRAGGMTTRNDMIAFIKIQYGLVSISEVVPTSKSNDESREGGISTEDQIARMAYRAEGLCFGMDHIMLAREIYNSMNSDMKDIYYKLSIEEKTLDEIAGEMECSTTSIHNRKNEIRDHFARHFQTDEYRTITEEDRAVIRLVSMWIMEERKT
jgi:hypothetical protein